MGQNVLNKVKQALINKHENVLYKLHSNNENFLLLFSIDSIALCCRRSITDITLLSVITEYCAYGRMFVQVSFSNYNLQENLFIDYMFQQNQPNGKH